MKRRAKRSFRALMVTQFFGAFNDNVLKNMAQLLVLVWVVDQFWRSALIGVALAVFVIPFLLFSMLAGCLADRFSKSRIILVTKLFELVVVLVAIAGLAQQDVVILLVALFLLATQSAFFGPAKYGILPELMNEEELSRGNGLLNGATNLAILIGMLVGVYFVENTVAVSMVMVAASIVGIISAEFMQRLPAAKPGQRLAWNPVSEFLRNWREVKQDKVLTLSIIAVAYFWFIGAACMANVLLYAEDMMRLGTPQEKGQLLIPITIGIAIGSVIAGKMSKRRIELGLVPIGAFGMSLFCLSLLWSYHWYMVSALMLFFLGLCSGLYCIPLNALIQWRAAKERRGQVLGTMNFVSFVGILFASLVFIMLSNVVGLDPAWIFFVLGLLSFVATGTIFYYLPDFFLRLVFYLLTNTIYRIRVSGQEHVPDHGAALLVCNHLSLVDGFLVNAALSRRIRFLVWRLYYDAPWLNPLARIMRAIPISETDPPKEILRSLKTARRALQEGELVCIFAEGQISRTGNLLEFKKGFEVIAKGFDAPVLPVNLDRVWGSIFSFAGGKALWKLPRRLRRKVTVTFGSPVAAPVDAFTVRQAVMDLGAAAFGERIKEHTSLPASFLRTAKRRPFGLAVADAAGMRCNASRLAAAAAVLARQLSRLLPENEHVGILLPPSVPAVLANLAVSLAGKIPVNLNYTVGTGLIRQACAKAKIKRIITARPLLEKVKLEPLTEMLYLEDVTKVMPKWDVAKTLLAFLLLPLRLWERRYCPDLCRDRHATAGIIFSSGSTGDPKGIELTNANIMANVLGVSQVFDVGPRDRMLGILPFFHSFGFTVTLWFPLINALPVVYHTNPLDAKTIGKLAEKFNVSFLLATPTFLASYIRRCAPEQFRHLRFVITGAERLRATTAQEFAAKFGVQPLEGYGCTELSPAATINSRDVSMGEVEQVGNKPGTVGHPLPGVSVRIVDPDSFAPLPQGDEGLLLVTGPNVMKGYLDDPEKTAAAIRDGWYVTGDIAAIDPAGFVRLVDRLSRFSKIGGEMVPHVLIEEKLHDLRGAAEREFVVTGVPDERKGERLVVLYLRIAGSIDDLCGRLQESDLPKLWLPARDDFHSIESFPLLGSGKLDIVKLNRLACEVAKGARAR